MPCPGTRQLANTNYGVCVKRGDNYCDITWEPVTGNYSFTVSGTVSISDAIGELIYRELLSIALSHCVYYIHGTTEMSSSIDDLP